MAKLVFPWDHDWFPDDDASSRHDPGRHYMLQFEQLTDVMQRREKWLLGVFAESVDIWLRILPSDPNAVPCTSYNNDRGQSHQDCLLCYGTGMLGGYIRLTLDTLSVIRLDQARNCNSAIDGDMKRLISNREDSQWDESRYQSFYDINTGLWLVSFPQTPRNKELMDHGLRQREDFSSCWFFSPVRLDDRDFFIRNNGIRYKFKDIADSTWRGKVTHTQFSAVAIDFDDIIYKVGIEGASVTGFELSDSPIIQEQIAQEHPIFSLDTSTENDLIFSFDFSSMFSNLGRLSRNKKLRR